MYRIIAMIIVISFVMNTYSVAAADEPRSKSEREIGNYLHDLFDARSQFLLSKEEKTLNKYYLPTEKASKHALKQEEVRKEYIHAWAAHRKIHFVRAVSHIRIPRIHLEGDRVKVSIVQSQKLEYEYSQPFPIRQSFGVGTRHALTLTKKDGQWYVLREWYSDPLNENPKLISKIDESFPNPLIIPKILKATPVNEGKSVYHRDRAVAYANKYAGSAWGAGNNNRSKEGTAPILLHRLLVIRKKEAGYP